jgi:hypothetical protein
MELMGRNRSKAPDLPKLRKQLAQPRDRFFSFNDDGKKRPHEIDPTFPSSLFTL